MSEFFLTLLGFLKDFIIFDLADKFLGMIDNAISEFVGVFKILSSCDGAIAFAFMVQFLLLFSVMIAITAFITINGGIVFAFILGLLMAQILNQLVEAQIGYCKN